MSRPRLLDLFCGAGGAAMGYSRAGFEVVGVDIEPQPNYPFRFFQDDALAILERLNDRLSIPGSAAEFYLDSFDAIHASPPCQRWSTKTADPESHPDLVTPLRPLLEATGLPYVIENVPAAPLSGPILCGSSFGLAVRRHRRFETQGFDWIAPSCAHGQQRRRFSVYDHGKRYLSSVVPVYGTGGGKAREHWREAMGGITWMTDAELAESIPPAMTECIGGFLMQHIEAEAVA